MIKKSMASTFLLVKPQKNNRLLQFYAFHRMLLPIIDKVY